MTRVGVWIAVAAAVLSLSGAGGVLAAGSNSIVISQRYGGGGNNAADFTTGPPAPRNSANAAAPCGVVTPTSPTVSGDPATADSGSTVLLTAHVTPGANPASTGLAVTGDLTQIGGSASQAFFDD